MNNRPFPPIILTHITKDNALFNRACESGVNKLIETHHWSHLTAVPVPILLKSSELTTDEIYWVKSIAGLNVYKNKYGNGYGDAYGEGFSEGYGCEYKTGNGEGYGSSYGNGEGYGNGYGDGYGEKYGEGTTDGDGYGDNDDDNHTNSLESNQ